VDELNNVSNMELVSVVGAGADIQITLGADSIFSANATLDASQSAYAMVLNANVDADDMYIVGTSVSGGDSVTLGGGADTLISGAGDDFVNASAGGADRIDLGANNDTVGFATFAGMNAAETVVGGSGTDKAFVYAAGTMVDADLADLTSIEILKLTGANTLTIGSEATDAGLSTIEAGAGNTNISSSMSTVTVDADVMADNTLLSISGASSSANFVVSNLEANFNSENVTGSVVLNLGNVTDNASTLTLGAGNTTLSGGHASDTYVINAILESDILNAAGVVGDMNIVLGSGAQTIYGGMGVDTITSGAGTDRLEFSADSAKISNISAADTSDGAINAQITTITDYQQDVINFVGSESVAGANSGTAVNTNSAGFVTGFRNGEVDLWDRIQAMQSDEDLDAANTLAMFLHNGSTYVYYSGTATGNADDQILRMLNEDGYNQIVPGGSFYLDTAATFNWPITGTTLTGEKIITGGPFEAASSAGYVLSSLSTRTLIDPNGGNPGWGTSIGSGDDYNVQVGITSIWSNGMNFFNPVGTVNYYNNLYMGSNGYVTFGRGYSGYVPQGIAAFTYAPMIAAQFDDLYTVDGRNVGGGSGYSGISTGSGTGYYYVDTTLNRVVFTWDNVGLYSRSSGSSSGTNGDGSAFQIILQRLGAAGSRDFSIEIRYEDVNYQRNTATAGWTAGDRTNYQLVDNDTTAGYDLLNAVNNSNIGVAGVWAWNVVGGVISSKYWLPDVDPQGTGSTGEPSTQVVNADLQSGLANINLYRFYLSGDDGGRFTVDSVSGIVSSVANAKWNLWKEDYKDSLTQVSVYGAYDNGGTTTRSNDKEFLIDIYESGSDPVKRINDTSLSIGGSVYLTDLNDAADSDLLTVTSISAANAGSAAMLDLSNQHEGFTIRGSAYGDSIVGSSQTNAAVDSLDGADVIYGGGGNDTLVGHDSDVLFGGANDDLFVISANTVVVTELVGEGTDTVSVSGLDLSSFGALNHIEAVAFTSDVTLTGSQADSLSAIYGGAGSTDALHLTSAVNISGDAISGVEVVYLSGGLTVSGSQADAFGSILGTAGADTLSLTTSGDISGTELSLIERLDLTANVTLDGAQANALTTMVGSAGANAVYLADSINAVVGANMASNIESLFGSAGGDSLTAAAVRYIDGGAGNDYLTGGAGADTLLGGANNDTLSGSTGDSLLGGAGDDLFIIENSATGFRVSDTGGSDTLSVGGSVDLTNADLSGIEYLIVDGSVSLTGAQANAFTSILGATGSTDDLVKLTSSVNGAVGGNLSGIESLIGSGLGIETLISANVNAMFIDVPPSQQSLVGGASYADTLVGGVGQDTLVGGTNDSMLGAGGNDLYVISSGATGFTITDDSGTDTLSVGGSLSLAGLTLSGLEVLAFDGTVSMTGDQAAAFTSVVGVNGSSDIVYLTSSSTSVIGTHFSQVESIIATSGVDIIAASTVNGIYVDGKGGADSLVGSTGNDTLIGGAGVDTLVGGAGDSLVGGADNDLYIIGSASAVVVETDTTVNGIDSVSVSGLDLTSFSSLNNIENVVVSGGVSLSGSQMNALTSVFGTSGSDAVYLTQSVGGSFGANLSGIESLFGTSGNDTMSASNVHFVDGRGGADTLLGSSSADTLVGGAGNDTLVGGTGDSLVGGEDSDLFIIDAGTTSFYVSDAGANGTDTMSIGGLATSLSGADQTGIEYLIVDGAVSMMSSQAAAFTSIVGADGSTDDVVYLVHGDQSLVGANFSGIESLFGGIWADRLVATNVHYINGLGGDDSIVGDAAFADMLIGLDGNDTLVGQSNDTLDAGANNDWVIIANGSSGFSATGDGLDTLSVGGAIDLTGAATGFGYMVTDGSVSLTGSQANAFTTIYGASGSTDDVVYLTSSVSGAVGGNFSGIESLFGSAGSDVLNGGSTAVYLSGGNGNDTLSGGAGTDTLVGGSGQDLFVISANGTIDVVSDFDTASDVLMLGGTSGFGGGGFDNLLSGSTIEAAQGTASSYANALSDAETYFAGDNQGVYAAYVATDNATYVFVDANTDGTVDEVSSVAFAAKLTGNVTLTAANLASRTGQTFTFVAPVASSSAITNFGIVGSTLSFDLPGLDSGTFNYVREGTQSVITNGVADSIGGDITLVADGAGGATYDLGFLQAQPAGGNTRYLVPDLSSFYVADEASGNASNLNTIIGDLTATEQSNLTTLYTFGFGGDDTITGLTGKSNYINAGLDNDSVLGGSASDTLLGDSGLDTLKGGSGADFIYGGVSADRIEGEDGNDYLEGNEGDDLIYGGANNDTIQGGSGSDTLSGGSGDDLFVIDSGTDYILDLGGQNANPNADELDVIQVASGTTLYATVTDDWTATSATRNDGGLVYLTAASLDASGAVDGIDIDLSSVTLGSAGYVLDARGTDSVTTAPDSSHAADWLFGSGLADTFYGSGNGDWIKGNGGADYILAGGGADTVEGGVGNDTIAFLSWLDVAAGVTSLVDADSVGGTAEKLLGARNLDQIVWLSGDKIDLSGIDADSSISGANAVFTFDAIDNTASTGIDAIDVPAAGHALLQTGEYSSASTGSFTHTSAGPDGLLTLNDGTNIVRIVIIGGGSLSSSDLIL
jgi:Ca2+-binding RTX toxin-like protein